MGKIFIFWFCIIVDVNCKKLTISISKYESPPTRWMSDGYLMVGVTDSVCRIWTEIWKESKKAAGKTYSETKAIDFVESLSDYDFYTIVNPYDYVTKGGQLYEGSECEYIEAEVMFKYYYCKVLIRNDTNCESNEKTCEESLSKVKNIVDNLGYTMQGNKDSKKKDKKRWYDNGGILFLVVFGSIIGFTIFVIIVWCINEKINK